MAAAERSMSSKKPNNQVAESVFTARQRKIRKRAERKAAQQAAHEAELPLTPAQRELIARARQDLIQITQELSRIGREEDAAHPGERALQLRRRKREIGDMLLMLVRTAEEAQASETARLMTARPRGRALTE